MGGRIIEAIRVDGGAAGLREMPRETMLPLLQPWNGCDAAPVEPAWAAVGWSMRGVCARVVAKDSDIVTAATENDQKLWTLGDTIEFFFKPGVAQDSYWEIHVAPNGYIMDILIESREKFRSGILTWDEVIAHHSGVAPSIVVNPDQNEWTVEVEVPWSAFGRTEAPAPEEIWQFAICRYNYRRDRSDPELSTTAPLQRLNFHNYEDYDLLQFR